MIIITNPHFSQYRVSRDSLPTQLSNLASKKRTNKFDFTTCRLVFLRFLEESEDTKKPFRNKLTFKFRAIFYISKSADCLSFQMADCLKFRKEL